LDVYFGRRTAEDPDDRPRSESLDLVEELGGTVVHTFNLPMARVIVSVDSVPLLSANYVDGVTDSERVDVEVIVMIPVPLSAEDRDFLEELGVEVIREHSFFITALAPDDAIPAIRTHTGVAYVEASGVVCVD
jgi:hypothetical protein